MAVKTPGTVAEQPPFGRAGGGGLYWGRGYIRDGGGGFLDKPNTQSVLFEW